MRDNRRISILIGAVVFIHSISVVFIVNRRHPAIKELAIDSTNETNSVDEFVPEE